MNAKVGLRVSEGHVDQVGLETKCYSLKSSFTKRNILAETVDACLVIAIVAHLQCLACRSAEHGERLADTTHTSALIASEDGHKVACGRREGRSCGQIDRQCTLHRILLAALEQWWHIVAGVAVGQFGGEGRLLLNCKQLV